MANTLEFHYVDSAKKKSIEKAVAVVDALKDVSILAYDDTEIKASINDVSSFAHSIHVPENVSELTNDQGYLVQGDVSDFVTKDELDSKHYLTEHQSLTDYAKNIDVNTSINNVKLELQGNIDTLDTSVQSAIANLASQTDVKFGNTENLIDQKIENLSTDLTSLIQTNRTAVDNNLDYAIERVRADYDASIADIINKKQNKLIAGLGISIDPSTNEISANIDNTLFLIVDELPVSDIDNNKIYVVSTPNSIGGNMYSEYFHTNSGWEKIGEFKADADFTNYYNKAAVDDLITAAINDVSTRIAAEVAELGLEDTSLGTKISTLDTKIDNAVASITADISTNMANIAANKADIDDAKIIIANNTGSINTIETRIGNLEAKEVADVSVLNNIISSNSSTISRHETSIENLGNNIANEEQSRIDADASINAAIEDIDASIVEIKNAIEDVDNIDEIEASISGLDASISVLDASIKGNKSLIEAQSEIIDGILEDVNTLKTTASGLNKFAIKVVETVPDPTDASLNTIYLVKKVDEPGDMFEEFILVDGYMESLGHQEFAIENYATIAYVDASIAALDNKKVNTDDQYPFNNDISTNVSGLLTDVDALKLQVDNFVEKPVVNDISTGLNDVSTRISNVNTSISSINTSINTSINNIDSSIGTINTAIEGIDASVVEINTKIESIDASIGEINTKIEGIDNINTEIESIDSSISTIETNIEDIDASIDEINTKIEGIDASLENIIDIEKIGDLGGQEEEYTTFDYIYDENSWNDSLANGTMKMYYEKYPFEDLYNESENRVATYNDRQYVGDFYNDPDQNDFIDSYTFKVTWQSNCDKITRVDDNSIVYYIQKDAAEDNVHVYEVFNDAALTDSAGVFIKVTEVSYPGCVHSWQGIVNAPGAKLPWICPYFTEDVNAKIKFVYKGKQVVMPWGDRIFGTGEGHKTYGWASVAEEFQDNGFLIPENQNNGDPSWSGTPGDNNFDISKFKVIIAKQDVPNTVKSYIDSKFDTLMFILS